MGTPAYLDSARMSVKVASSSLALFGRVKFSADNTVDVANAGDVDVGTLLEGSDLNGYRDVRLRNDPGTHVMIASGAITQFAAVYGDDSGKVTATRKGEALGIAMNTVTTDGQYVVVLRTAGGGAIRFSKAIVASSTAVSNTAATAFDQTITIPKNTLKAGDRIKVRAKVTATTQSTTVTHTVRLLLNSTVLHSSGAVDPGTGEIWDFNHEVVVRTVGASGTLISTGTMVAPATAGTITSGGVASTAIDTTADIVIKCDALQATASGNSDTLDILSVEVVPGA